MYTFVYCILEVALSVITFTLLGVGTVKMTTLFYVGLSLLVVWSILAFVAHRRKRLALEREAMEQARRERRAAGIVRHTDFSRDN
jgi:hypothetical protein